MLRAYRILDTPADPRYDGITELAAGLTGAPCAVLAFAGDERVWIKSAFGCNLQDQECPGLLDFLTAEGSRPAVFANASADSRFAAYPFVRGCIAVPVLSSTGHAVGYLAAFDRTERRDFDDARARDLLTLALQVTDLLEHDAAKRAIALRDEEVSRLESRIARLQAADPAPTAMPCLLFLERLSRTLTLCPTRSALLFVDIHAFTRINVARGREGGDDALREIAARIREFIGDRDTFTRRDADHFAIIVDEFDPVMAAQMRARLEAPLTSPSVRGLTLAVKIGGVRLREVPAGARADRVVKLAERAAAESIGAVVFATEAHRESVISRDAVLMRLVEAVEQGSIDLHYQPLVEAGSGRFMGFEALARWTLPDGLRVEPAQFMELADRYGQAFPLGEQLLRKACSACCEFVGVDPNFALHVNVSPVQLLHPLFEVSVADALRLSGMPAKNLCLEITEAAVAQPEIIGPKIARLRESGLRFALDDFGMGFSSLSHVRRLPVDALKIDRCFVSGAGEEIADAPIARTVTTLAKELGLQVIAEGIETPLQAAFLRGLGCDVLQGYYFGRPEPISSAGANFARR